MTQIFLSTLSGLLYVTCILKPMAARSLSAVGLSEREKDSSRRDCACDNVPQTTRQDLGSIRPPFKFPGAAHKYSWLMIPVLKVYDPDRENRQKEQSNEDYDTDKNEDIYLDKTDRRAEDPRNFGRNKQSTRGHRKSIGSRAKTNGRNQNIDESNERVDTDQIVTQNGESEIEEEIENNQESEVDSNKNNLFEETLDQTFKNEEKTTRNQRRNNKDGRSHGAGFQNTGSQNYNNYGTNQILIQRRSHQKNTKTSDQGSASKENDQDSGVVRNLLEKLVQSLQKVGNRGSSLLSRGLNGVAAGIQAEKQFPERFSVTDRFSMPAYNELQPRGGDNNLGLMKPATSLVGSLLSDNVGISI